MTPTTGERQLTTTNDILRQNTDEHMQIIIALTKLSERNHELLSEVRELTDKVERTERDRVAVTHKFSTHMEDADRNMASISNQIRKLTRVILIAVGFISTASEALPFLLKLVPLF